MKRTAHRTASRARRLPPAWGDFEYAGLHGDSTDTLEDRISESLLDSSDDRGEVEVLIQRLIRGVN